MHYFNIGVLSKLHLCLIALTIDPAALGNEDMLELQTASVQACPIHDVCWRNFSDVTGCCGYCSCGPDCLKYGSCCLTEYSSLAHAQEVVDNNRYGCVKPQYLRKKSDTDYVSANDVYPVWMITKCQLRASDINREHCEHPDLTESLDDLVPVYYGGTHYRNKFCAYCNGVSMFSDWRLQVQCEDTMLKFPSEETFLSTVKRNKCNLFFRPPVSPSAVMPRTTKCQEQFYRISTCNETGLWPFYNKTIDMACQSYQDAFNITYKNYFCYLCNTDEPLPRSKWECVHPDDFAGNTLLPPFIAILDLGAVKTVGKDSTELVCESGTQFEDKKKMKCLDILCDGQTVLSDGGCRPTKASNGTTCTAVYIKFTPVSDKLFLFADLNSRKFKKNLQYVLRGRLGSIRDKLEHFDLYWKRTLMKNGESKIDYMIILMKFQIPNFEKTDILSELIIILHQRTVEVETNDHSFLFETEYVEYDLYLFEDRSTFWVMVPNESGSEEHGLGSLDIKDDTLSELSLQPCSGYTSFNKLDFCPFIKLGQGDLSYEIRMGNLIINETFLLKVMNRWEFKLVVGNIFFCVSDYKIIYDAMPNIDFRNGSSKILSGAKEVFSFICVCLSVLCLVITIVIYATMAELHSQPGINTIILCVTLLLAQITYQFGTGQTDLPNWACAVIGALSHLLWLSVMFSMNVCSVDMFRIFRKVKKLSPSFYWKATSLRVAYIVLASFTFVLLNYIISASLSNGKNTGYGGAICYLSSTRMHLVTFIIPSMLTITVNFVLYFYVVIMIGHMRLNAANLRQERNYFGIYTRLSTLTGVTWLLGYLQILIKSDVLEYQFILLNAGQGVFIMIAFVCNKRVLSLFRRKAVLRKNRTMANHMSSHTEQTLSG